MAEESWILDGIINLLSGPVWTLPILTFIEEKSVIFEPEETEEQEEEEGEEGGGEKEREIHAEYKKLVDTLLQSFLQDLSLTNEDLERECEKAAISTPFQKGLLEQIWAADDFSSFKKMMKRKNLELQYQALNMLKLNYGIDLREGENGGTTEGKLEDGEKREREVLEEVYRLSREDYQQQQQQQQRESRDIDIAIKRSIIDETKRLQKALKLPKKGEEGEEEEQEEEEEEETEDEEKQEEEEESAGRKNLAPLKTMEVDEAELEKRKKYLQEQRNKLLEMKRRERTRQLEFYESQAPKHRPQSAQAARKVLEGGGGVGGGGVDPNTLAARRALAQRLKAEVIKESD